MYCRIALSLRTSWQLTAESRLPPDTSSQFIDESRSRWVLPCTLSPNHGSRMILRHNVLEDRGLALDFLAICDRFCVRLPLHNLWRNQLRNVLITYIAISGATHCVNSTVTCGACPVRPSGSARPTSPSSSAACFPAPNHPPANFFCVS